jgi:hypothetical protein
LSTPRFSDLPTRFTQPIADESIDVRHLRWTADLPDWRMAVLTIYISQDLDCSFEAGSQF